MEAAMPDSKVRYAVVGLGYFAQSSILPAFERATGSELVGLVSDDPVKLEDLGDRYGVPHRIGYGDYDRFLQSGAVDAVYIALPNALHCDYTVRAAAAGVHVLCEKPMATTEEECRKMIDACGGSGVRLMIAYRLHFEAANLEAVGLATSGALGDVRAYDAAFTMQVRDKNIRVRAGLGGGPLEDIGIYCINAARYIFRDEPTDVVALAATRPDDPRFDEVDEQISAVLKFPGERLATFLVGFGAADASRYEVIGTRGRLRVEPAFETAEPLCHELTVDGKTTKRKFAKRDQVAPEIIYFSHCIRAGEAPEPSGMEGLADVRVMQAIHESIRSGRSIAIEPVIRQSRPTPALEMRVPAHDMPKLVRAEPPSQH
jgi:glucose-fructose oxidoreductase